MRLHFEPDLDYQRQAIDAVADLFRGQEVGRTAFTVSRQAAGSAQGELGLAESDLGIGNRLRLLDEELLANLRDVQLRHGLRPADALTSGDFTVEMETGTGKTYVYLRTVFELHRRYGFTKFVVVVPSVAIKEGVYKTLQMTAEHFRGLYANTPFDYFLYDSARLGEVRNFATSARLQIMVVTVGAINKRDVNNLYKDSEKTGGERPIDLIRATNPVVIVDEPQSVDGGLQGSGRKALAEMNPLCTLRYSATHADKHHMVYRLDAVDAYQRKLVKEIEVAALEVEGAHNTPYIRLDSVSNARGVRARLELDVASGRGVARKIVTLPGNRALDEETGRAVYAGYRLGAVVAGPDGGVEITGPGVDRWLTPGQAVGGVDDDALKRHLIRRTVEEHLAKEKRLAPQGIKVLTLFFVDAVEHYRRYDADGAASKGKYALMFEEEFRAAAARPQFRELYPGGPPDPEPLHNGYFAVDRRVVTPFEERELKRSASKEAVETDTYNLIMRDKERLLDPATPLRFIFSHSALREGWDNPNVFQICTLREIGTERERRQTIGRGLRLCVDHTGQRRRGADVNTLTVIATESYQEFADQLQKEIEADTGIRFGVVQRHDFAGIAVPGEGGVVAPLGVSRSEALWEHFERAGYVDPQGRVRDALRVALRDDAVDVPADLTAVRPQIVEVLRKLAGGLQIKNANERRTIAVRRRVLDGEDFRRLWDRIKHRTTYRVDFDNDALLRECTEALRDAPPVATARVTVRKAGLAIGRGGVEAHEIATGVPVALAEDRVVLPDVLGVLEGQTQLTRRSLARILTESGRLDDFRRNPQHFLEVAAEAINRAKRLALVDGIRYRRIGDDAYYAQELFAERELVGYLKNTVPSERSPYDYVVYDSETVERPFAEKLEGNDAIRVYAKLPDWFKVPTPLGTYNPDWALLIEVDGAERLYLVVETKGSVFADDLRSAEGAKIACGRAHFRALSGAARVGERPAEYRVERSFDEMMATLQCAPT